jgi:LuxR family transcriptional regulator of csgAB operon
MATMTTVPKEIAGSVVIIGGLSVQNWLIVGLLEERLGSTCEVRPLTQSYVVPFPGNAMVLVDVEGLTLAQVDRQARLLLANGPVRGIALINADEAHMYALAYVPEVRGVFYRSITPDQLVRGVRAMMLGEYWLPRKVLERHFRKTRPLAGLQTGSVTLTEKETETLLLLTGGYSNSAIARRLGVSAHTVKTHLYNLSRKIGARNRVQAAKWAMENLHVTARGE